MSETSRTAWSMALFLAVLAVVFTAAYWLGDGVGPVGGPSDPPPHEGDRTHSTEVHP